MSTFADPSLTNPLYVCPDGKGGADVWEESLAAALHGAGFGTLLIDLLTKQEMAARQQETSKHCLTKEEAKKPKENFFASQDKSCRYAHFTMGGGKMDMQMVCKEETATQTMNMSGSYTPTSYSMDMSSSATGGHSEGMSMKMHVDANRVGECTGEG